MSRALVVFGLALLLASRVAAAAAADPSIEAKVKIIRARYAEIERELKQCRQVKRNLPDESAEGGELTAYFKEAALRKLSARFFGESGRALMEYYLWEGQLFFVLRVEEHYDKPLSGVVKSKSEERFYFADGALLRWLDAQKKEMGAGPARDQKERELLADSKKYSAAVTK